MSTSFYCVTGSDFFPGAVALINSLRLHGHREQVYVLDCGLTAPERDLLAREATVVEGSGDEHPTMRKFVAPLAHPAATTVILDADLIITRPLDELIEDAAAGRLVGFENDHRRHFEEWGALLEVPAPRPGPYLSSSALFCGGEVASGFLPRVADAVGRLDSRRTWIGEGAPRDPFFFGDQDVVNALALSLLEPGQVSPLPGSLAPVPPFAGLRIEDEASLLVARRGGQRPFMLHHFSRKPWLVRMRSNVYSRLLPRLLFARDLPLRLDPQRLPLRLRPGARAGAARLAVDLAIGAPAGVRRRLPGRRDAPRAWPQRPPSGAAP